MPSFTINSHSSQPAPGSNSGQSPFVQPISAPHFDTSQGQETVTLKRTNCAVAFTQVPQDKTRTKAALESIRRAIQHNWGSFQRVEFIVTEEKSPSTRAYLLATVENALRMECGWMLMTDESSLLHKQIFEKMAQVGGDFDALWGIIVEQSALNELPKIRQPQLMQIQSASEIALYPASCSLGRTFFVKTELLREVLHRLPDDSDHLFGVMLELWKTKKCTKLPVQFSVEHPSPDEKPTMGDRVDAGVGSYQTESTLRSGSMEAIARQNELTGQMQEFQRKHQQACDSYAASLKAPWYGYFEIQAFAGTNITTISNNDDLCTIELQWNGVYEPTSTYIWQRLANRASTILDIGAYTGLYSLLAAATNPNARIMAFEPSGRCFARLLQNGYLNQMSQIQSCRTAVGKELGQAELSIYSQENCLPNDSSIMESTGRQPVDREIVSMVSIDHQIEQQMFATPQLMKIDVEGAELDVLQGAMNALQAKPDLIINGSTNADTASLTQLLSQYGYHFFNIVEDKRAINETDGFQASDKGDANMHRLVTIKSEAELVELLKPQSAHHAA